MREEGRSLLRPAQPPATSRPIRRAGEKNKTALRQAAKALAPKGSRVNADLAEGVSDAEEPDPLSPLRRDDAKK